MAREGSPGLDTVLMDAFGTLLYLEPPGPRLAAELERRLGAPVSETAATAAFAAEIAYYLDHHLEGRDARSLAELRERCAEVIRASLRLPEQAHAAVREAMLEAIAFTAYPEAARALAELRAGGVRLVAASNWDCSLAEVLDRVGLGEALDAVVPSALVGAPKPDPRLFATALDAVGAQASRSIHVGDSIEHDVAGARAAGLRAVLVVRGATRPSGAGVPVVSSLAALPSLVFGA
ncbi:MAG: HAD family hydrolase [Thermoleophilaceae bacterium]